MAKRKKVKRRITNPKKQPLLQPIRMNLTWSMDFMQDTLENGRKFRVLNIIDDFNRESLTINISYSFPSEKVIEILEEVIEWRGKPESIRTENGTEFIAHAFTNFCIRKNIEHIKIQKGKPTQNSYIERFNRSYREDVLDAYIFEDLNQARIATELFMEDYNNEHPHESLGDKSPIEFLNAVNCGKLNAQSIHTSLPQLTAL
jgi:putative transposase